jgi:hypothetical protein
MLLPRLRAAHAVILRPAITPIESEAGSFGYKKRDINNDQSMGRILEIAC